MTHGPHRLPRWEAAITIELDVELAAPDRAAAEERIKVALDLLLEDLPTKLTKAGRYLLGIPVIGPHRRAWLRTILKG